MDPQDPNVAYSPSMWTKRFPPGNQVMDDYLVLTKAVSAEIRAVVPNECHLIYGPTNKQRVDIYGAKMLPKGAPVFVYVHGGYWVAGCREDSPVMAKTLFDSGIITAVLGYDLAPDTPLNEISEQIASGVDYLNTFAANRDSRLWLCGHSAGAHLAAMAMSLRHFSNLAGAFLVSGVFDLLPLLTTYIAKDAAITKELAESQSPKAENIAINNKQTNIMVAVGEYESDAFKQQSRTFSEKLSACELKSKLRIVEGVDHFDILTNLHQHEFEFTKDIIDFIKQGN